MEEKKILLSEMLGKTKIKTVDVEKEMKQSFIAYAMAVNVSRAIPDVRDGLKPVHRRILYAMNELGLSNDKPFRKCARIVGDVLGKYHPHGDTAVYDALVRLAQDFTIRATLVEGHGNFGSIDGDRAAAQRYTEARLSKISSEMLKDIEKDTVEFYPNFDETLMQPSVLPSRYPNLLVNGADGIAVGMATSIPPHNLGEIIDGTIALLDDPDLEIEDLMRYIPCPDYPTGGLILGRAAIAQAYRTGRGHAILRAKTDIEEFNQGLRSRIVVTEIPYQVNKAKLIESIANLVKDKRIEGISDIREESDRDGMRIVIEIKKGANPQVVLNHLYKQSNMQISNSIIMLALVDGRPKIMNLKEMLEQYILHQKEVIVRRTKYDLEKALEKDHILRGLVIALNNIDEVIAIIKASKERSDAMQGLIERFELSEKQVGAILDMRLSRLTSLEVEKIRGELKEIEEAIAEYRSILESESKVIEIIKSELNVIKDKYSDARRSELTFDYDDIDIADLIDREEIVISLTHFGYIKRMPLTEYRAQKRGGVGITAHRPKEEDFVERLFTMNTHDDLLIFTNKGKVYSVKGYEIPPAQRTARGRAIVNLIQVSDDEKVAVTLPLEENNREGNLLLATKQGKIKKTPLNEFSSIRVSGKIAIKLVEDDELISAELTTGSDDVIIAASSGKCIRFSEKNVREQGRDTQGVKSINLTGDDVVVDMTVITPDLDILTVSDNGYGKRTSQDEYRTQGRAGKGIKAGIFNKKTGKLVNLKLLPDDMDIMLITNQGIVIRMDASDISKIGRNTQGVRLMRIKEESKVVAVALAPKGEEEAQEE